MLRVGNVLEMMWLKTLQLHPKLAVIDDDNYIHAILASKTEEEQDKILEKFLADKAGRE